MTLAMTTTMTNAKTHAERSNFVGKGSLQISSGKKLKM